ncbi:MULTISPECIES: hypothetical protein [Streptosporangium]|uniref:Uncharacterized protein n=1 Tax=Streptosporangium brasiliense TaxID=47480 RepID=A0ABT9RIL1_9ACTN|nr:hypothetical protein [Streptosporangium brasiliense]MDP9868913.1 hypothetical protein [Streptosporangium brasiliense]
MPSLTYTVLTDPVSLEASEKERSPSKGTVYLIVTNLTEAVVDWSTIEVTVPVGDGAYTLTPDTGTITPSAQYINTTTNTPTSVTFARSGDNGFRATARDRSEAFYPGDCMIFTLADVTLSVGAGPVVLPVTETLVTQRDPDPPTYAAVVVVKTTPQRLPAPHNFRADTALLDAGDTLTLSWEGSDDFDYKIEFPGGSQPIPKGQRSWPVSPAPVRATTYTLLATSRTTPQQEHALTTTVQVRFPVLETLTATTGINTPQVQGKNNTDGKITFTGTEVGISDNVKVKGMLTAANASFSDTVTARRADFRTVATDRVQGTGADNGWLEFRKEGVTIHRDNEPTLGVVYADQADLDIVKARVVRGRQDDEGSVTFGTEGLTVHRANGETRGSVYADRGDFNGINTGWLQGNKNEGKLSFHGYGFHVNTGDGTPGILVADEVRVTKVTCATVNGHKM